MKDDLESLRYDLDMAKDYINDAIVDVRGLANHDRKFSRLLRDVKDIYTSIESALDDVQEEIDELEQEGDNQ